MRILFRRKKGEFKGILTNVIAKIYLIEKTQAVMIYLISNDVNRFILDEITKREWVIIRIGDLLFPAFVNREGRTALLTIPKRFAKLIIEKIKCGDLETKKLYNFEVYLIY